MKVAPIVLSGVLLGSVALWGAVEADKRQEVKLPAPLKKHMLHNMRDHLQALHEILEALGRDKSDEAAKIAEARLGMSSMALHGADKAAPYMPPAMRQTGMGMHHAASRFALAVEEEDPQKSFEALSKVTASCIACHAQFKLR